MIRQNGATKVHPSHVSYKICFNLARVITFGAHNRNESRGAHYKPDFPERNDEEFIKTTMAEFVDGKSAPNIHYEEIDVSLIKPRKRDYTKKH